MNAWARFFVFLIINIGFIGEFSINAHSNEEVKKLFDDFIKKYSKTYSNEEEYRERLAVFENNLKMLDKLKENERGTARYGITKFFDLSLSEFQQSYGVRSTRHPAGNGNEMTEAEMSSNFTLPDSFDWRRRGAVTYIKDQGKCNSAWAFAVVGNVEGAWAAKGNKLIALSEQQLLDCDQLNSGCLGGYMPYAFEETMRLGGLESEDDYYYEARRGNCSFDKSKIQVEIKNFTMAPRNERKLAAFLMRNGPLAAALNAWYLPFYKSGILHPKHCNPKYLNHEVVIVGFGREKSREMGKEIPYWIIKNSWGYDWGDIGYFKLYRGDGTCGINTDALSAII